MGSGSRKSSWRAAVATATAALALLPVPARGAQVDSVPIEDYTRAATQADLFSQGTIGSNDFGGASGVFGDATAPALTSSGAHPPALRFGWDFTGASPQGFAGLFHRFLGPDDPHRTLNVNDIDAGFDEPGPPRQFDRVIVDLRYQGAQPLALRLEFKDDASPPHFWFKNFTINDSPGEQTIEWSFRADHTAVSGDPDLTRMHELVAVVERPGNPSHGSIEVGRIAFGLAGPDVEPSADAALLDVLERRTCQHFVDWARTATGEPTYGMPLDRSSFGDQLTTGGAGFALPAYAICAQRGWLSRAEAADRTVKVLRLLTDASRFGPEGAGRVGHHGFLYHFLLPDGTRKGDSEVSTIDTSLAVMGALVAQSYFDGPTGSEPEIRKLAQTLYDRVDWPFMAGPSNQLYLGWKPNLGGQAPPGFALPDAAGDGGYSSKPDGAPLTLDYYTDEAFMATLLAVGSKEHALPRTAHCAWQRYRSGNQLVRSFPGALFTYEFLHAFVDTRMPSLVACPGDPVSWYANSRRAIDQAIAYSPPDAWGISAADGPDDHYRAYGVPALAVDASPPQDATVTYYAMVSAVSFGTDFRARAVQAVRAAWDRGHWNPRFGLPDAFNEDAPKPALGSSAHGPWLNREGFAIDVGPMLLHLENARSGLVWDLMARNPNIQRALGRLVPIRTPLRGTAGNDTLFGDELSNVICGLRGNDRLFGRGGDDSLFGGECSTNAASPGGRDVLRGGRGDDRLFGGNGADILGGDAGRDALNGGRGDDKLAGGPNVNSYAAGPGNDDVNARNHKKETVDCGTGAHDRAVVDRRDKVKGCEKVTRRR